MTVTYTAKVATSSMGCFLRLLMRWRGSVYKLVWREFLIFFALYYTLAFVYRFALPDESKRHFEMVARYCEAYNNLIPLSFVLGFYVSVVLTRWWEQFNTIPWPDTMALYVSASIQGHDERGRLMRRTIMRYLCLSFVITLSSISPGVKKRFPTFQHMTDAGFMLENEQKIIEEVQTPHNKYFIPLVWSTSLVTRGRKEGRIKDDYAVKTLIDEINIFRGRLGTLFNYDWISVPLVYTQVAETLVNPFGEDDDDFDINQVIDRNLQVSYLVVDEMHQEHPELIKDAYWDEVDFELPYTAAAEQYRPSSPFLGSAMDINVDIKQSEFVGLSSIPENLNEEGGVPIEFGPRDIPRQRRRPSPFTSTRKPIYNIFKRSISQRTSRDSVAALGSQMRMHRQESITSKGSEERGASPTITTTQEEIFNMEDLSDTEEPELEVLGESANSQTSAFWEALHSKQMRALRKKENRTQQETSPLSDMQSTSRSRLDIGPQDQTLKKPNVGGDMENNRQKRVPEVKQLPLVSPKDVVIQSKCQKGTTSLPTTPTGMGKDADKTVIGLGPLAENTVSMTDVPSEAPLSKTLPQRPMSLAEEKHVLR